MVVVEEAEGFSGADEFHCYRKVEFVEGWFQVKVVRDEVSLLSFFINFSHLCFIFLVSTITTNDFSLSLKNKLVEDKRIKYFLILGEVNNEDELQFENSYFMIHNHFI